MTLTVFEVSLRQSEGRAAFAPDTGADGFYTRASRRWQAGPVTRTRASWALALVGGVAAVHARAECGDAHKRSIVGSSRL
jgi:hypothetical protein